jgi:hypothetical protein
MSSRPEQSRPFPYTVITSRPQPVVTPAFPRRSAMARTSRESGLVVFAIFLYFLVRGMMSTSVDRACDHAYTLLDLERALSLAWEADLQRWASGIPWLIPMMNSIYIYGHWPLIALTLGWLLWRHGDQFRTYRAAMVLSGLIGFALFALYPMAPPRFLPELGFVDTVMRDTSSYRVLQPPAFTNQYAAMPSLHVGWNLLMGIAIWATTRHLVWRIFAVVMPGAMWVATILTANHFVLDGVVGSLVALMGLAVARQLAVPRKGEVHEPAHAPAGGGGRSGNLPSAAA